MEKQVYEFISHQTNDQIIEWKTCKISGEPFAIFQSDVDFFEKLSPKIGNEKIKLPFPEISPEMRQLQRTMFRNERKLYRRICSISGKEIISMYPQEYEGPVYESEIWRSDKRDAQEYAQEINREESFTQQYMQLFKKVPRESLIILNSENSKYNNMLRNSKNCYMSMLVDEACEDLYYTTWAVQQSSRLVDCLYGFGSHKCYQSVDTENCYNCIYLVDGVDTSDAMFSYDLQGCEKCIFCNNLRNKKLQIGNKSCSLEEYNELRNKILSSYPEFENAKAQFETVVNGSIRKPTSNFETENCIGNGIKQSKNCFFSFDVKESEDLRYCFNMGHIKTAMDCFAIGFQNTELVYESVVIKGDYSIYFSNNITHSNNIFYSDSCVNCSHLFGCVGLRDKQYCIFNKEYTKEEREQNTIKLIQKMQTAEERGKFFDIICTPYPYNDTVATQDYPIKNVHVLDPEKFISDAILDLGGEPLNIKRRTRDQEVNIPSGIIIIEASKLDELKSDEEILKIAITCEISGRPFRIVKSELEFYRKMHLPLPRKHPDIRYQERIQKFRPPRNIYLRQCDKTGEDMLSVYPQEVKFKVYKEEEYNKEIYG